MHHADFPWLLSIIALQTLAGYCSKMVQEWYRHCGSGRRQRVENGWYKWYKASHGFEGGGTWRRCIHRYSAARTAAGSERERKRTTTIQNRPVSSVLAVPHAGVFQKTGDADANRGPPEGEKPKFNESPLARPCAVCAHFRASPGKDLDGPLQTVQCVDLGCIRARLRRWVGATGTDTPARSSRGGVIDEAANLFGEELAKSAAKRPAGPKARPPDSSQ